MELEADILQECRFQQRSTYRMFAEQRRRLRDVWHFCVCVNRPISRNVHTWNILDRQRDVQQTQRMCDKFKHVSLCICTKFQLKTPPNGRDPNTNVRARACNETGFRKFGDGLNTFMAVSSLE